MKSLQDKIYDLADALKDTKTQQKRIKRFEDYLSDWGISRLTSSKRKEIEDLLMRNNLEFIVPYSANVKVDVKEADKDRGLVLRYSKTIEQSINEIGNQTIENTNRPIYSVASGTCPKTPYPFQQEAFKKMNSYFNGKKNKKGLLVLPTGAGKTYTAVSWLLRNAVNEDKKVIWVAHRQELLSQVNNEIGKLCYSDLLPKKKDGKVSVHLISGSSDNANKIHKSDDIIIASVQSLNRNLEKLTKQFLKYHKDVFLVIDEAHHATARTYKTLIETVQKNCSDYNMLGLTATPYRTAEDEKSLLAQVFNPEVIYKKDLTELVTKKFLADPHFVPIDTDISFTKADFSEKEIAALQQYADLPESIKKKILERKDRDRFIVDHYVEHKAKYKQTIVFAIDQNHALTLDALLKKKGVKSDFVISGTQDAIGINRTNEQNQMAIADFRAQKLDTIVNVNILTEGTDLPKTQSVFLTRPTKSKTLMTQMVGRALRGVGAGGTKEAFIVSFIDKWDELVAWQSPEVLFNDGISPDQKTPEQQKYAAQLISIEMIQQFALLADRYADTSELQNLPAIMRIPVGWYGFDLEYKFENEEPDYKSHKVLVFEHHKPAFDGLAKHIADLFNKYDYNKNKELEDTEKADLLTEVNKRFFDVIEYPEPKIKDSDLMHLIEYFDTHGVMPPYFTFEERDAFDITKLANEIINKDFGPTSKEAFLDECWGENDGNSIWKQFYTNINYFKTLIDFEIRRITRPPQDSAIPIVSYKQEKLEDMPLYQWPPKEHRMMLEAVYERWNRENPKERVESFERFKNDIDHVYPISEGGKTTLENLRPLLRSENKRKGGRV